MMLNFSFIVLTGFTLLWFYLLTDRRWWVLIFGVSWLALAALLADSGFFLVTDTLPPRLAFMIAPMLFIGLLLGFSPRCREFRAGSSPAGLHYFHAVRIAIEVYFLHGLYEAGLVARAFTYEGLNYDIIPGVLLPLVGFFVVRRKKLSSKWIIAANVFGIVVLSWTVVVAVLSAPTPYQQFGLDGPTTAIFHFPWVWLPALVAPLMFWAHFVVLGRVRDGLGGDAGAE